MPTPPAYPSQVWDHLGLVAGRFDERGMGDVLDQATHQHPDMRDRTVGEAVNAMGLNGLGVSIQPAPWCPDASIISPPLDSLRPACPPPSSMMMRAVAPWRPSMPMGCQHGPVSWGRAPPRGC